MRREIKEMKYRDGGKERKERLKEWDMETESYGERMNKKRGC